jgi:excisionase family DNA binding protein
MSKQLDKAAAAAYLQVSERAIERYTKQGRLNPETIQAPSKSDGRMRPGNRYSLAELDKLKLEMENPTGPAPTGDALALPRAGNPAAALALARIADVGEQMTRAADALAAAASSRPLVSVESKLTLTLADAAALAGLSRAFLLAAIREEQLKAAKRGRGWNVKRADLDAWVSTL